MTYSLLATAKKVPPFLLPTAIAVAGVIVLIAFCIGFARGWRKVSWAGLVWGTAVGAFMLVEKTLGKKLPALTAKLTKKLPAPASELIPTLVSMAIAVIVTLLVYAVFSAIFRARYKEVRGDGSRLDMDENGIVYDDEYKDYDDYENYRERNSVVRINGGKPSFVGRIFGALFCILNVAVFVAVTACTVFLLLGTTSLKTGALASVYNAKGVAKIMSLCSKYLFDFLIIGLCTVIAVNGSRVGGASTLRFIIVKLGGVVAGIGSFVIPFTKLAKKGILLKFVNKCVGATASMNLSATVGAIVGKLLAGFLLCLMVIVAVILLNLLLKGLVALIDEVGFFRVIDSAVATLIYIVIGIAVCALIFFIFAVLAKYGIANIGKAFAKDGMASQMLETCRAYADILLKFKKK